MRRVEGRGGEGVETGWMRGGRGRKEGRKRRRNECGVEIVYVCIYIASYIKFFCLPPHPPPPVAA